jgi:RNA polymerase sigma-70 factor, ECF subfamily
VTAETGGGVLTSAGRQPLAGMSIPGAADRESRLVALLTEHQLPLLLYVRSLMPADPAARDVTQQANATIWQKRDEFELGTNFKAWAFSIARYEVLNHRKRQARDARMVFSDELEHTLAVELAETPTDVLDRHEALQLCLRKLADRDRALLLHRYSDAGPLDDFARKHGRSVGGLKVTLHRLRNTLSECIRRRLASRENHP